MISALAFFGLAIVIGGVIGWLLLTEHKRLSESMDRRLAGLHGSEEADLAPVVLTELPMFGTLLLQADMHVSREKAMIAGGALLFMAVLALLLVGPVFALVLILLVPSLVFVWIRHRAKTRVDALIEGLPHYVDGVRQLLGIGTSLTQAVVRALQDSPPSVTRYFEPAARRIELGTSVDDAIDQLAAGLRVPEVAMFAAAIRTQMRFGGSITVVLSNLAQLLRDRIRVRRDLKAATAEARVSGRVLIAMPLIAMTVLVLGNPEYPRFFLYDPRGQNLAIIAIVLQAVGILILRRQMELEF